ncbi:PAT complex subunit Asterix isoform X2 [Pseudophryne corroboree]|uniref:PAT complex subunit Asterix isoform X2 n=1 Tax=Pseudophryne corroboree TaxID=495146 RepID=UPI003081C1DE
MTGTNGNDPRRPGKVQRYKPPTSESSPTLDDPTPDYMNLLGMIFSMCGLMLKAIYFRRGHVLSTEPTTHVSAVVTPVSSCSEEGRCVGHQAVLPLSLHAS